MQQSLLYKTKSNTNYLSCVKEDLEQYVTAEKLTLIHLVTDCAMTIQRTIGLGLSKKTYQTCLANEFFRNSIPYEQFKTITIPFGKQLIHEDRLDFLVNRSLGILLFPIHEFEILADMRLKSYLKYSGIASCMMLDFAYPIFKKTVHYIIRKTT